MFYKEEGVKIMTHFNPFVQDRIFLSNGAKVQMPLNPISTGHGRNQPIYERHMTTAGRNRVNVTRTKRQQDKLKILPLGGTGRDFERMARLVKRQVKKASVRGSQFKDFWTTLSMDVP